jgi:hypothetical protein
MIQQNNLKGITDSTYYLKSDSVCDCRLGEYNEIKTLVGTLIPQYNESNFRKKNAKSISFYKKGSIKSISLETSTPVNTSAGIMNAELVTFYEDGRLRAVFPLNGQIGFGWTEEEEGLLTKPLNFDTGILKILCRIICVRFFKSGKIKNITFWPSDVHQIETPAGKIKAKNGLNFYADGTLKSFEPAEPTEINTPIGKILSFDNNAEPIRSEKCSITFYRNGILKQTAFTGRLVVVGKNQKTVISSHKIMGYDDNEMITTAMHISFTTKKAKVTSGIKNYSFDLCKNKFLIFPESICAKNCGGNCNGCSL